MSKIGRNDFCPCGSGKKYKHCHINSSWSASRENIDTMKPKASSKLVFQNILDSYQTEQLLLVIGALQLHPPNHALNVRFEAMATKALKLLKKNATKKSAAWSEVEEAIKSSDRKILTLEPWNTFTGNVVYRSGNRIVYPGIHIHGSKHLNDVISAISIPDTKLPEEFSKLVGSAIGLLLELSDSVAKQLGHFRYMDVRDVMSDNIQFPTFEEGGNIIQALMFDQETIDQISQVIEAPKNILDYFVLNPDEVEKEDSDPDNPAVSRKPFIKLNDKYYLYMPTAITNSLVQFSYAQSVRLRCENEFKEAMKDVYFGTILRSVEKMQWRRLYSPAKIGLSDKDILCQFDQDRFAYITFLDRETPQRNKQVFDHLRSKNPEVEMLTIYVPTNITSDFFMKWGEHEPSNYSLMFQVHELEVIASRKDTNSLTLWLFAKALYRAGKKMKFPPASMLVLYANFLSNNKSFFDPNEAPTPIFDSDDSDAAQLLLEHELREDEHSLATIMNGKMGFLRVHRMREYAPIYKPLASDDFTLVVKAYKRPIWISNKQKASNGARNWGHDIVEASAYWMLRLADVLRGAVNVASNSPYYIEIIVDEKISNGNEFIIPDKIPEDVGLDLKVTGEKIEIGIPFEFCLLAWRKDNRADKTLLRTVFSGIMQCSAIRGIPINVKETDLIDIIEQILVPDSAKMILFSNGNDNPRLDTRNLPPLHTTDDSEIYKILDELLSYLPADVDVPVVIKTRSEKIILVDQVIQALLEKLKSKIRQFNGVKLLERLIMLNECCIASKEVLELTRPAKVACFSSFKEEVDNVLKKESDLISTGHSLRTLIEFTGTCLSTGSRTPGYDEIGELLAFADRLMSFGQLREVLENNLADPKMGKRSSGRIGINKDFQDKVFISLEEDRAQGKVLTEIEKFEARYSFSHPGVQHKAQDNTELNAAFEEEFGFSFEEYARVVKILITEGFEKAEPFVKRDEEYLLSKFTSTVGISKDKAIQILTFMTLPSREEVVFTKNEKDEFDKQFVPWRFNRSFSYLMKPLIRHKDSEGKIQYYFGYRHLQVSLDHYIYLIFEVKLPSPKSAKMRSLLGKLSHAMGTPFEKEVREWLKANTDFEVQPAEVYPWQLSKRKKLDEKYGDIDAFAVDHKKKIIYSIECKNTRGAKNIIEMVGEMNVYLGREETGEKSKILKHYERDEWLKQNLNFVESIVPNASEYTVKSLILTADELSISYLGGDKLLLPVVSFSQLKILGAEKVLGDL